MSIVLVGGHDRMHAEYKRKGKQFGHEVRVYTQMPARFEKMIGSPDGIVVFTATSSHKMVKTALGYAKKKNIPVIRCHNSSSVSLESSIVQLEEHVSPKE